MAGEKRSKEPEFGCEVYSDGVNFRVDLGFYIGFVASQGGLSIRFEGLMDADLEQLEMDLKRHLETVKKMRLFSRGVSLKPEKLMEGAG